MAVAPGPSSAPSSIEEEARSAGFELGRGGRARHPAQGPVLLERLPSAPAPQAAQRLLRLEHRHLLRVFYVGHGGRGAPFLLYEEPRGPSLASLRERGPIPTERALQLLGQAAAGLAALHQAGFCHRALSPRTVFLLAEDGEERVALAPPRTLRLGTAEPEVRADLRALAALFDALIDPHVGPERPPDLDETLRWLRGPGEAGPRTTVALYAAIESAARRGGAVALYESASLTLPGDPPSGGSPARTLPADDSGDATIEVEPLDPQELLMPSPSLQDLEGPLDRIPPRAEPDAQSTVQVRRLEDLSDETPQTAPPQRTVLLQGPARWLLPLGALAVLTLALALWVLLRGR